LLLAVVVVLYELLVKELVVAVLVAIAQMFLVS
jgi:hypothetical protein